MNTADETRRDACPWVWIEDDCPNTYTHAVEVHGL